MSGGWSEATVCVGKRPRLGVPRSLAERPVAVQKVSFVITSDGPSSRVSKSSHHYYNVG